jgi:hypothetical protein
MWPQAAGRKRRQANLLALPLTLAGAAQQTSLLAGQQGRRRQRMHPAPQPQTSRLAALRPLPPLALLLQGLWRAGRCRHLPPLLLPQWRRQQPQTSLPVAARQQQAPPQALPARLLLRLLLQGGGGRAQ